MVPAWERSGTGQLRSVCPRAKLLLKLDACVAQEAMQAEFHRLAMIQCTTRNA